jgi:DNA-binding XRE family transcriptional regulator
MPWSAIQLHRRVKIKLALAIAKIFRLYWFGDRTLLTQKTKINSIFSEIRNQAFV